MLLHTADVHKATFNALRNRIAPNIELDHIVRSDWLTMARKNGISEDLKKQIAELISARSYPVLCTCTSIGEAAENAGALRIDRPMMEAAASTDGPILLTYALESTAQLSLELLKTACASKGHSGEIFPFLISDAWSLFEAGETTQFCSMIAKNIREKLQEIPHVTSVILAQASMASAASLLTDLPQHVYNSPESAFRAAVRP